jgi:hypothetical protein
MTAQITEKLIYEGERYAMCTNPLDVYLSLSDLGIEFESTSTALWRGYVGTWEIKDDRLYLIKLNGTLNGGSEADLETVFPGYPNRVFAHWFSGEVRIPQGKILNYVHMGYGSTYERDLLITIADGVVTRSTVQENGVSDDPAAKEGYSIGAMTNFGNKSTKGISE